MKKKRSKLTPQARREVTRSADVILAEIRSRQNATLPIDQLAALCHKRALETGSYEARKKVMQSEVADTVIRLLEIAAQENWPIGRIIADKLAMNLTRGQRHGGKLA